MFWKSLFLQDKGKLKQIVRGWGIENEDLFASMQLMRPYQQGKPITNRITKEDVMKMQVQMKEDVRKMMKEVNLFPQELLFVNRNMNLVRSINKKCGSLVNRINIMARYASIGCRVEQDILDDYRPFSRGLFLAGFWFEARLLLNSLLFKLIDIWMKIKGKRGFEDFVDQKQR